MGSTDHFSEIAFENKKKFKTIDTLPLNYKKVINIHYFN